MTREKKELLKQLEQIDIANSLEYSIGELSERAIQAIEDEIYELKQPIYKRLNELMHGRLNDYFQACVI